METAVTYVVTTSSTRRDLVLILGDIINICQGVINTLDLKIEQKLYSVLMAIVVNMTKKK